MTGVVWRSGNYIDRFRDRFTVITRQRFWKENLETMTIVQVPLFVSQTLIMRGISIMGFKRRRGDWKEDGKSLPQTSEAARGELSVLANQKALSDLATNQSREY